MFDYLTKLDTAFWAVVDPLLPTDVVAPGCRMKDSIGLTKLREEIFISANDWPVVGLNVQSTKSENPTRTFAQNSPSFSSAMCDQAINVSPILEIVIRTSKERLPDRHLPYAYIEQALWSAYPHLNVTDFKIVNWRLGNSSWRYERVPNGLRIPTLRVPWSIEARIELSVLAS